MAAGVDSTTTSNGALNATGPNDPQVERPSGVDTGDGRIHSAALQRS